MNKTAGYIIFLKSICFLYVYAICKDKIVHIAVEIPALEGMDPIIDGKTIIITIPAPNPVTPCTTPAQMATSAIYNICLISNSYPFSQFHKCLKN